MKRKDRTSSAARWRAIRRTAWLVTVLSPLFFVTACLHFGADKPKVEYTIPESVFQCRQPRTLPPEDTATQADVDVAMTDIYLSWEATCENLQTAGALVKKTPD
jgi:hypothetical protein